jgi:hypothetical protein
MKKIGLILSALFAIVVVNAQIPQFGIKGGVNVSNVNSNEGTATSSRLGFHVGALAHIHLGSSFAIQPEAMYSSQGFKYVENDPGPYKGEHSVALDYVNVPVLLQYMIGTGFRLETGPQLGVLVNVADRLNGTDTKLLENSDFKTTDFAWVFGAGLMSNSGLGIDVRYNLGLSNIRNIPGYTSKVHNGVFQAGLFYQFANSTRRR